MEKLYYLLLTLVSVAAFSQNVVCGLVCLTSVCVFNDIFGKDS